MRLIVASSGIFISAVSAFGQVSALSPEDQKAYRDVVLTFVLADECSKRHQNPQIFEKATELFQQTAVHYKLPDAETEVAQAAQATIEPVVVAAGEDEQRQAKGRS